MRNNSIPVRAKWRVAAVLAAALILSPIFARPLEFTKYHNYEELTAALQSLAKDHPNLARLAEIGKSREGRSIWALEIANPAGVPVESRPGLLIAANFEADQLIGSALALYTANHLLTSYASNPEVKRRLDSHVFYIIPRMNPDGAQGMFAAVKTGRKTNATPFDDDNDGRMDEDGPEDLNNDGFITMMRVKDPRGEYMIHPDDARLMRRADAQRGETGGWSLYWEGIDNDKDGFINEDPPGGVDLNRNFMHKYPYYAPDAGPHMASEPEVRAVLDYILKRRNIAAILAFGESDNLIAAPAARGETRSATTIDMFAFANQSFADARRVGMVTVGAPGGFGGGRFAMIEDLEMGPAGPQRDQQTAAAPQRMPARAPVDTVNASDAEYMRTISEKYRALTNVRNAPAARTPAGAFYEYGYYQFGVFSFSTPGWGLPAPPREEGGARPAQRPAEEAPAAAAAPPAGLPAGMAGRLPAGVTPEMVQSFMGGAQRGGAAPTQAPDTAARAAGGTAAFDLRLLRWMDAEKIDGFVNWTPFKHPTLGEVEIGGFKPYAYANPPAARIEELGKGHAEFALYLTSIFPKIGIAETSVASLGGNLFRIKAEIENTGFLPTAAAQGVTARSSRPVMVQLGVNPEDIVSGASKTNYLATLAGSGRRQKYEWIVKGKPGATVTLKVVAPKAGSATANLTLK